MADDYDLHVQVRILPLIGPGKMQLLEAIDRHGSISAAARAMGMAYPNAWKLMDSLNRHFRDPLVTRVMGGSRGGGAALTETGRAVLGIYRSVEAKAKIMFAGDIDALRHLLAPQPPVDPAPCEEIVGGPGSPECREKKARRRVG
ncbi:winged helix-turn-helix domain-containing protein [Magnetospirillum sulfuroxidans]|uniref:LysR family transcriptional regulator n=1 Tax=Magnetospirillum sulfuroxidans TaxID=611300 RepID=A0ABS5IGN2_9PROT|nr:LysR family transcriptional regulator [Magnetospirillum sulfuroxidans]MBR9973426.1 LysR family transcriptional regulator [Magnetospirillum sulfuroxidans]